MKSQPISEKMYSTLKQVPYLPRTFRLIWQAAPGLAAGWLALLLMQGLLPALSISLSRLLVNQLVMVLQTTPYIEKVPWAELTPALFLAGAVALVMLLGQLLASLASWVHTAQTEQVQLHINMLIQQKSSKADYSLFESSEKNDTLYRARMEGAYRPVAVLDSIGMLVQGTVTLAAMLALLLPYGPWLVLILLASSLPVLWIVVHYKRKQHAWQKSISSQERRAWYYDWLLTSEEAAAELRLFGTAPLFMRAYQEIRGRVKRDRLNLEQHQLTGQLGASFIGLVAAGACMIVMVWRALQGMATLGDLVLFYQVVSQGQTTLRMLLQNIGQLYGGLLFLSNLFEFLDLENQIVDTPRPVLLPNKGEGAAILFEDVTFSYPGSQQTVLSHFNLEIEPEQLVAIVGDNGAGKSTLLKLLCRLYDPQGGRISYNGVDLRHLAQQELRSRITVLFQQPMHYQATVRENIGYSDMTTFAADGNAEIGVIHEAAQGAGAEAFIEKLPRVYETQLGKWFEEGTDLSVGQWQRIALARAYLRQSPLMLLDEPTSALDAWSEVEWLSHLRQLSIGRTTILITHRLTTAMQADVIHVMVDGQIIESGTHGELLACNGRYATAWRAQMRAQKREAGLEGIEV